MDYSSSGKEGKMISWSEVIRNTGKIAVDEDALVGVVRYLDIFSGVLNPSRWDSVEAGKVEVEEVFGKLFENEAIYAIMLKLNPEIFVREGWIDWKDLD